MRISRCSAHLPVLVALLLSAASGVVASPFEELELCVPAQAMGGAGVVLDGLEAVMFNPAAAATIDGPRVSAASRLPFTSFDFATHGLEGGTRLGRTALALSVRYFGGDLYSEQMLSLTAALQLTGDMAVGIQPVFCRAEIADGISSYGSASAVAWNLGARVNIYGRWRMGFSMRNPFGARIGSDGDERLQRRMDVGVGYEPEAGMISLFGLSRDFRGLRLHVGQSLPLGPVVLRAGVHTDPVTISGGLGAEVSGVSLEYAIQSHPELPPSHQLGVSYGF
ncbi:hypothetical protein JW921_02715 [Candidatus Fermentibacterales bacterium]|nr:hypothetical protein [Candidatus Fermentibacterales bacterium]